MVIIPLQQPSAEHVRVPISREGSSFGVGWDCMIRVPHRVVSVMIPLEPDPLESDPFRV